MLLSAPQAVRGITWLLDGTIATGGEDGKLCLWTGGSSDPAQKKEQETQMRT